VSGALLTFTHPVPIVRRAVTATYRARVVAGPAQPHATDAVTVTVARP